jgi:starvation-inducible DNA-binding protein
MKRRNPSSPFPHHQKNSRKKAEFSMNPTKNDLSEAVRDKMVGLLNARLADVSDLASQAKQAHWNVKGINFIALHELFDDIYTAAAAYADLIAERCVQLGGQAMGTVRQAAQNSSLTEYPVCITASLDHVEALSNALAAFGKNVRAAIDSADQAGDADTADMFTEISRGVDKFLWFVEAHAQPNRESEK